MQKKIISCVALKTEKKKRSSPQIWVFDEFKLVASRLCFFTSILTDNDNSLLLELRELAVTCADIDKSETSSGTRAMDKKVRIL